jgi:hypothetical protein
MSWGGPRSTFPHTVFMVAGTQVGWVGVGGGGGGEMRHASGGWCGEGGVTWERKLFPVAVF